MAIRGHQVNELRQQERAAVEPDIGWLRHWRAVIEASRQGVAGLDRGLAAGYRQLDREIVAHVAPSCFANFFCQAARPAADFPLVALTTDEGLRHPVFAERPD